MTARLLLCLLLSGCASDRYLTPAEDETMRKNCEPMGCTIIPTPLWEQVKKLLGVQDI